MSASKPAPSLPTPRIMIAGAIVVALGFLAPMLLKPTSTTSAPPSALANNETPNESRSHEPSPMTVVLKMAVGIGVTALLCVGLTRILNSRTQVATSGPFEHVGSMNLPGPCVVHLVRVGDRKLLVGTDRTGVKAILELPMGAANVVGPLAVTTETQPQDLAEYLARR
jgi:flagellar protein FliO/FliZ